MTKGLGDYIFLEPTRSIRDFVGDLSQWYLRRSRDRFKGTNETDKQTALATTRYVLVTLAKVMAPFTPFFAEYVYKGIRGDLESVHLENWPDGGKVNTDVLEAMKLVRELASNGLEARMAAKINVRQPLRSLKVQSPKSKVLTDSFVGLIRDEVNVKEVIFGSMIEKDVELDTVITPELKEEGMVRELIRAVQDLRKEKGLSVSDSATLTVETDEAGKKFIEKNRVQLMATCTISEIKFGNIGGETVSVGDISVKLGL